MENRNIGDYDTCPNGCKYCYANQNPKIAQENYKKHNSNDLMILGNLKPTDEIQQSRQKSFLENYNLTDKIEKGNFGIIYVLFKFEPLPSI